MPRAVDSMPTLPTDARMTDLTAIRPSTASTRSTWSGHMSTVCTLARAIPRARSAPMRPSRYATVAADRRAIPSVGIV